MKYALIASFSLLSSTAVLAQAVTLSEPTIDQSRVYAASKATDLDFVDPGNEKAKRFAGATGVSVGEATSQLKRNWALNQFIDRLQKRNPDLFSFVAVRNGVLTIGLTDPQSDTASLIPPGLGQFQKVKARYSKKSTREKIDALKDQVRALGFENVTVGVDGETGKVEFMSKAHADGIEVAIANGKITPNGPVEVIRDDIVLTNLYGGLTWNADEAVCAKLCGGTTGFSMISTTDSTRYVSTAGHIDNNRARYNTSFTSTYASGGVALTLTRDLSATYRFDVQYATPASPSTNIPNPYIWDGTQYVLLDGWTYPTMGSQFCKFGRITKKTCGVHDTNTMLSNTNNGYNYTYLYRVKNNGSGSNFVFEGDSGGPVYYGTWAVGWIHGRDSSYNLYYSAYSDFRNLGTGVDIILYY